MLLGLSKNQRYFNAVGQLDTEVEGLCSYTLCTPTIVIVTDPLCIQLSY